MIHTQIWRQQSANACRQVFNYQIKDVTPEMSFLEMLDALNGTFINRGELRCLEHDCRRGSAARAVFLINGVAHGGSVAHRVSTLDALLQG